MSDPTKEQIEAQRNQVEEERNAYRNLAMQAEANELLLHRQLHDYLTADLDHYRSRAKALEKAQAQAEAESAEESS